ncbi:helix-turn-helix domain-containing protein [Amycolatopsis kentuckyensis]|uniref:helix-turn-helix domain-containing protein n=1 Tax=Amycolatopsis kentuckyensis TaxID=218823 RepID=UPI001302BD72|nr:helix-turn-helix domain-containing protein [Amycolatopsis kentuckyensis]
MAVGERATFGAELRRLRQKAGLSLGGLAELTFYSKGYLSKVENGLIRPNAALAALCETELGTPGELVSLLPAEAGQRRPRSRLDAIPSGLPPATAMFTGRTAELGAIRAALETGSGVCVISGLGGVGKTALAVRCAHRLAAGFADGCLFVDLRGRSRPPVAPSVVHDRVLRRLGVVAERIPADPDDRAALYSAHLRDRNLLLVLDNAVSAAQVQALLPGGSRCRVLVTSRSRLTALDDAEHVSVGVLPRQTAIDLFAMLTGADEVGEAGHRVVERCGRLPLAIRIAAARLRAHPMWDVDELDRRLADASALLTELDDGERSLAASFQLSAGELEPAEARMLRLLAPHPGADFDVPAASALGGLPSRDADRLLDRLHNVYLVGQPTADRYSLHDLVRTFALTMPGPREEDAEALRRMLEHYLAIAEGADRLIAPNRFPMVGSPGTPAVIFQDAEEARRWLEAELPTLVAMVELDDPALDVYRWQLAYVLRGYFYLAKELDAWLLTHAAALGASRRLGDSRAEAITRNNLGMGLAAAQRLDEATEQHDAAYALFDALGDQHGLSDCLANLAAVLSRQGRFSDALEHQQRALRFYSGAGLDRKRGITLRSMSTAYLALGRVTDAVRSAEDALALATRCAYDLDIAQAANALGAAREEENDHVRAEEAWRTALAHGERCSSVHEQAGAHWGLGRVALARGRTTEAEESLRVALLLYESLNSVQVKPVAELIKELRRR